jgi:type IV fimbrial biogenesis protein FimT
MKFYRHQGFTIIEIMIALVIVGILLSIAAPSFSNLIKNNRMLSEVYALRATLNTARSEALSRRTEVTVCSSSDGTSCIAGAGATEWNQGHIMFADDDNDDTLDPNEVFYVKLEDANTLTITYLNTNTSSASVAANQIQFNSRGYARRSFGTLEVCDDRGPTQAKGIIVAAVGTVSSAVDTDSTPDGIANDHNGDNFDCN